MLLDLCKLFFKVSFTTVFPKKEKILDMVPKGVSCFNLFYIWKQVEHLKNILPYCPELRSKI